MKQGPGFMIFSFSGIIVQSMDAACIVCQTYGYIAEQERYSVYCSGATSYRNNEVLSAVQLLFTERLINLVFHMRFSRYATPSYKIKNKGCTDLTIAIR